MQPIPLRTPVERQAAKRFAILKRWSRRDRMIRDIIRGECIVIGALLGLIAGLLIVQSGLLGVFTITIN